MALKLTDKQKEALVLLNGPQRHTLAFGGARSGKTFLFVLAIVVRALKAAGSRHVIFRFRANSIWASIGLDTLPRVLRILGVPATPHVQDRYYELPNGSQIWLAGLDDKDRVEKILGMEFVTIYFNEASQIAYASYLLAKTRLAQVCKGLKQRLYIDLNPSGTAHWTHRIFLQKIDPDTKKQMKDAQDYVHFVINPMDNQANLSPEYLADLDNMPERARKRFFEGKYADEIDNPLWTLEILDRCRFEEGDVIPQLRRVVVAVDPSGTKGEDDAKRSDEIGIIVAGLGFDGKYYVLADRTCRLPPHQWANVVVTAYHEFQADEVVAEINFGGAMVQATLHNANPSIPFREAVASRGKAVRAEPISTLYSKGLVRHVERFVELEDQMLNMSTAGYLGDRSPDRLDADIWAISALVDDVPPIVVSDAALAASRLSTRHTRQRLVR